MRLYIYWHLNHNSEATKVTLYKKYNDINEIEKLSHVSGLHYPILGIPLHDIFNYPKLSPISVIQTQYKHLKFLLVLIDIEEQ